MSATGRHPRPDLARLPVRLLVLLGDRDVRPASTASAPRPTSSGELRRYDPRRQLIFFYDDNFAADAGRDQGAPARP
ncbi:MAG: hypothetical protein MZU79_04690 [Anaerotruncus sp.]|nr:hypothetical protein [Anaerotruncus sp.]